MTDRDHSGAPASSLGAVLRRPVLAFGIPTVLLAAVVVGLRLQAPTLSQRIARDYRDFESGELFLEMSTPDGSLLEEFFVHRGIDFETRVPDLTAFSFTLSGGRVHRLAARPSAAVAYAGPADELLLSQRLPGTVADLPRGATIREHAGIRFHVQRQGNLTLAFWQEGAVICVLVSEMGAEDLLRLAFAMAIEVVPDDGPTRPGESDN